MTLLVPALSKLYPILFEIPIPYKLMMGSWLEIGVSTIFLPKSSTSSGCFLTLAGSSVTTGCFHRLFLDPRRFICNYRLVPPAVSWPSPVRSTLNLTGSSVSSGRFSPFNKCACTKGHPTTHRPWQLGALQHILKVVVKDLAGGCEFTSCWMWEIVQLSSAMRVGSMTFGICQLYCVGLSNKQGIFIYYYSYIQGELGNLGGVILPTSCARIIVHPMTFRQHVGHPSIVPF